MSAKNHYDLTQGGIVGKLIFVAAPIMGTQLLQMAYNLTDMFWLGRVSSDVVAAAGTAGMYLWLTNGFMFIGRTGAEIGVAQCLGRGQHARAREYSQNALFLSLALGVILGLAMGVFHRPLIGFFALREQHVVLAAEQYLIITAIGVPASMIAATIAGTFNAAGNSRMPFLINLVGLGVNMLLDPVLIFNYDMGIAGAAIATTLAQVIACVLSLLAIRWHRTRPLGQYAFRFRPQRERIVQIFKWGTPIALENMLFCFLSMITTRFVAAFGANATAVQKIGLQIESLSWLIAGGFSSAVAAFTGQNFGAGKWSRIRHGMRIAVISMTVWGGVVTVILFFLGGPLTAVFLPEPELVEIGEGFLRILALSQIPLTLEGVCLGGFQGMGRTLPPATASITINALRVPLGYFLSQTSLGLDGIWWGVTIGAAARGLWIVFWYLIMLRRQPKEDIVQETVPDAQNSAGIPF